MSFEMEKEFFKLMNNGVYGETIKKIISPKLLFTDTESLVYEIKTHFIKICLILVIIHEIQRFFHPANKKVISERKYESDGKINS